MIDDSSDALSVRSLDASSQLFGQETLGGGALSHLALTKSYAY